MSEPRDHHYVPQFYLRNFSIDPEKKKVAAVTKHGRRAVWAQRSIKSIGYERDLYVSLHRNRPISVETVINNRLETPISQSDTWQKITSRRADALDASDKPILYGLIRHLEARTPHYLNTMKELAAMTGSSDPPVTLSKEEHEHFSHLRAHPNEARTLFNLMSSTSRWADENYSMAAIGIMRSKVPIRTATTPVIAIGAPVHPALHLPLPGMTPYQLVLALDPYSIATLVFGDFDGAFNNIEIDDEVAQGFNRHFVGYFAYFDTVRHLVTGREGLEEDMTWAPYRLVKETRRRVTFERTD